MTEPPDTITPKRWRVTMADQAERVIEARGFHVEGGALIFNQPAAPAHCAIQCLLALVKSGERRTEGGAIYVASQRQDAGQRRATRPAALEPIGSYTMNFRGNSHALATPYGVEQMHPAKIVESYGAVKEDK